jgi:hypothetical protein
MSSCRGGKLAASTKRGGEVQKNSRPAHIPSDSKEADQRTEGNQVRDQGHD